MLQSCPTLRFSAAPPPRVVDHDDAAEIAALAAQGVRFALAEGGRRNRIPHGLSARQAVRKAWLGQPLVAHLAAPLVLLTSSNAAGLAALELRLGALPATVVSRSPRSGVHCWYWSDAPIKSGSIGYKICFRVGPTRSVAVPPAPHAREPGRYVWLRPPSEFEIAELPEAWAEHALRFRPNS
jgi:hypothetical protein